MLIQPLDVVLLESGHLETGSRAGGDSSGVMSDVFGDQGTCVCITNGFRTLSLRRPLLSMSQGRYQSA